MKRTDHLLLIKDHEIAELVNNLRDAALKHGAAQSLRAKMAYIVKRAISQGKINYQNEVE